MSAKKSIWCRLGLHSIIHVDGYDFCMRPGCAFENPPGWLPTDDEKKEGE